MEDRGWREEAFIWKSGTQEKVRLSRATEAQRHGGEKAAGGGRSRIEDGRWKMELIWPLWRGKGRKADTLKS
jgi:hypothetical protein